MSNDLCELDPQQLAHVTGGGVIANWLARRPLLRALLAEILGGGKGGAAAGGGEASGGEAASGAEAGAGAGAGAPKRAAAGG